MLKIQENSRKLREELLPALEEQLLRYREQAKQTSLAQENAVEQRLQELQHKVSQLTSLMTLEQSSLATLQEENHQLEELIAMDKQLLETQRKAKPAKAKTEPADDLRTQEFLAKDLRRAVQSYERGLGLTLRRLPDHGLKLTFTQICRGREELEHSCVVHVRGDTYAIAMESCKPPLDALPALLAQLNSTNHFASFVRELRKEFCRLYA